MILIYRKDKFSKWVKSKFFLGEEWAQKGREWGLVIPGSLSQKDLKFAESTSKYIGGPFVEILEYLLNWGTLDVTLDKVPVKQKYRKQIDKRVHRIRKRTKRSNL